MGILESKNNLYHAICAMLRILWVGLCAWFAVALPIFLIGLLLLLCLNTIPYRNRSMLMCNYTMIVYLIYSSLLMLVIGIFGLIGIDFTQLVQGSILRIILLNITFFLYNLLCFYVLRYGPEFLWKEDYDRFKVILYTCFLFMCSIYHIFDATILTLYDATKINYILLLSGEILILILTFNFLNYNYVFIKGEALKKQYEESEILRAQQYFEKQSLKHLSEHDFLTKAYNRREICSIMQEYLENGKQFICVFIDLDGLKRINDQYGHTHGDLMLKHFADACGHILQDVGEFARIGGDEFLLIFLNQEMSEVEKIMERLQIELLQAEDEKDKILFSYGISSGENSVDDYITSADQKMYSQKKRKRSDLK